MFKFSLRQTFGTMALVAGLVSVSPVVAHASSPLRGYMFGAPRSTMNKADWSAFHEAAGRLLSQMPSSIGQSETWQGPTGAHGTLTIEKIYERQNMPCRDVQARFNNKRDNRSMTYNLAVCRDAQGEWRVGT